MIITVVFSYLLTFVFSFNQTVQPIWVTSSYFRAGNQAVISTLTGSSANPPPRYTFTFSSPLTGIPELGYGIKNYEGNDYMAEERF